MTPDTRESGRDTAVDEAGTSREQLLIRAFVGLADTLVDDYDVIDLLDRLVGYSVELLPADAAGILLADPHGALRVVASSNEQTEWIELMQLQADQGPCVDCFRTGAPVSITDLADATSRWPRLAAALADQNSYRSVHALPLRLRGEAIGAMNLFHHQPGRATRHRPGAGAGAGRRGHHRDPAGTRHPPRRGAQRATPNRAQQPHPHRAGQGGARRARAASPWTPRSTDSAATHADTTSASARSPNRSSTPTSPQPCSPPLPPPGHPQRESGDGQRSQGDQVRSWLRRPARTMVSPSSSSAAPS